MDNRNYKSLHAKIINKKKYTQFINESKLIKCRKLYLIEKLNQKYSFFPKSNTLFSSFIINAKKEDNLLQLFRLQLLLKHFISSRLLESLNKTYLNNINKFNDKDIFDFLLNKFNNNNRNYKKPICPKWDYILDNIILQYKHLTKKYKNNKIKYLDIGCGDLKKTLKMKKFLNLSKEDVYGTDIKSWGPYKNNKYNLDIQFEYILNNKLQYEDNSFDLITCIYTLHHIEKLEDFLKEINRVLKKNGYLILIEHDINSDYDRIAVTIEHILYSCLYEKRKNYIKKRDYMLLFNRDEWNYLLNKYGFQFKYYSTVNSESGWGELNYNNSCFMIYKKN